MNRIVYCDQMCMYCDNVEYCVAATRDDASEGARRGAARPEHRSRTNHVAAAARNEPDVSRISRTFTFTVHETPQVSSSILDESLIFRILISEILYSCRR